MGGEVAVESWFSSLFRPLRKSINPEPERKVVGVLSFEVARIMSKLVNLWKSLSDAEIFRLREEILKSVGTRKLVSDSDDILMDLVLNEIIETWGYLGKSVIRVGKSCMDPVFYRFEQFFNDPLKGSVDWFGLEYKWKKMERKIKKMERFIGATMQLLQELEVLAELEQTLRGMQAKESIDSVKVFEFQQKVLWQEQQVKIIRQVSPWNRTVDYTAHLLIRSLFTILDRAIHVFGIAHMEYMEANNSTIMNDRLPRSLSFSALMQSAVHPSDNGSCGFYSAPLGRPMSKSAANKSKSKVKQGGHRQSSIFSGRIPQLMTKQPAAAVGPFRGCMISGSDSPGFKGSKPIMGGSMRLTGPCSKTSGKVDDVTVQALAHSTNVLAKLRLYNCKNRLSNIPSHTLADAALSIRYAKVILLIEKLVSSPGLIETDARDDLYHMLPTTVKIALRRKLKLYSRTLAQSAYNAALSKEWSLALMRILEWLAPLAHNTMRWQSEQNFEKQQMVMGTNVLLIQTLNHANQCKAEAAITELLMGLNYLCRFRRENRNTLLESESDGEAGLS